MGMLDIIFISILIFCLITDIKSRKIYNAILLPGYIFSFAFHGWVGGWQGLWMSLLGFFVGFMILLIPYFMGGIGAGDVKLLAFIGAVKGVNFVIFASIYMAVIGSIVAIFLMIFSRRGRTWIQSLWFFWLQRRIGIDASFPSGRELMKLTYPYGVAIVFGALLRLGVEGGGWM